MSKHPFRKDQKVLCVRSGGGCPLEEGKTYTVRSTFRGNQRDDEAPIPGMEHVPGVTTYEVMGHFTADRFEATL